MLNFSTQLEWSDAAQAAGLDGASVKPTSVTDAATIGLSDRAMRPERVGVAAAVPAGLTDALFAPTA